MMIFVERECWVLTFKVEHTFLQEPCRAATPCNICE